MQDDDMQIAKAQGKLDRVLKKVNNVKILIWNLGEHLKRKIECKYYLCENNTIKIWRTRKILSMNKHKAKLDRVF